MPPRPSRLVVTDPNGKRFELDINVEIYRCYPLEPRSDEESDAVRKYGSMMRILWCKRTYDQAVARYKSLVAEGHRPERIEFVHADRDELQAFRRGDVKLVPVSAPVEDQNYAGAIHPAVERKKEEGS